MAKYSYKCENCETISTDSHQMGEDIPNVIVCPACGATAERFIQPVQITYNGKGWTRDRVNNDRGKR